MGIFSRARDIVSSNVNSMLDKAENPEKMVRLMIREMEDALVEIKASCARAMADQKKIGRQAKDAKSGVDEWAAKAKLAVDKGYDDLAREALLEKHHYIERSEFLGGEQVQCDALVEQYQSDIIQLEEKLNAVREKQRVLIQRHKHAREKKRSQCCIRRADSSETLVKFERFEHRVERMEAEADLVNYGRSGISLKSKLHQLGLNDEIERELEELKTGKKEEVEVH